MSAAVLSAKIDRMGAVLMPVMGSDRQVKHVAVILAAVLLAHGLVVLGLIQLQSVTMPVAQVTTTAVRLVTITPDKIDPLPPKPVVKPKMVPVITEQPKPKPLPIVAAPITAVSPVAVPVEKPIEPPAPTPVIPQPEPPHLAVVSPPKTEPTAPKIVKGVAYLVAPKVRYPESERVRGVEGIAILRVLIHANGTVDEVKIERSSGSVILDKEALRAVRTARYSPYSEDGIPITRSTLAAIDFSLNDR
jgi:periplasmic protein TonB